MFIVLNVLGESHIHDPAIRGACDLMVGSVRRRHGSTERSPPPSSATIFRPWHHAPTSLRPPFPTLTIVHLILWHTSLSPIATQRPHYEHHKMYLLGTVMIIETVDVIATCQLLFKAKTSRGLDPVALPLWQGEYLGS